MHSDRDEFRCSIVHVVRWVYLAEFDYLCVGERGGVFDQLDEFAGSEAQRRR